jgi:hypothetical protein
MLAVQGVAPGKHGGASGFGSDLLGSPKRLRACVRAGSGGAGSGGGADDGDDDPDERFQNRVVKGLPPSLQVRACVRARACVCACVCVRAPPV